MGMIYRAQERWHTTQEKVSFQKLITVVMEEPLVLAGSGTLPIAKHDHNAHGGVLTLGRPEHWKYLGSGPVDQRAQYLLESTDPVLARAGGSVDEATTRESGLFLVYKKLGERRYDFELVHGSSDRAQDLLNQIGRTDELDKLEGKVLLTAQGFPEELERYYTAGNFISASDFTRLKVFSSDDRKAYNAITTRLEQEISKLDPRSLPDHPFSATMAGLPQVYQDVMLELGYNPFLSAINYCLAMAMPDDDQERDASKEYEAEMRAAYAPTTELFETSLRNVLSAGEPWKLPELPMP